MSFFKNPKGYPKVPLIEVASLQRGYDLPVQNRVDGSVPIYAANGQNGNHNQAKATGPGVVTGRSGTIGKVHYVEGDYWPLNTALYVTDFHGNHPKWVYYMLQAFKLERFVEGAGVPTLNRNLVHGELIPLPPLSEQKRIAAILDKADSLRRKNQQAIQLADKFLRAVFLDMFGDPVTNPKDWGAKTLKELTLKIGSGATPRGGQSAYVDEGISLIRSLNIHDDKFVHKDLAFITDQQAAGLSNVEVMENDVLLNITGASVCRCSMVDNSILPARVNQHVCIIRPQNLIPEYLLHVIISKSYKQHLLKIARGAGATREALTKEQIENLFVPVPPLDLQMKFSKILKGIKSSIEGNNLMDKMPLFESLSQKAFAGEL